MKKQQHRYRLTISYWIYSESDEGAKQQAKEIIKYEDKNFDNEPQIVCLERHDFGKKESEVIL